MSLRDLSKEQISTVKSTLKEYPNLKCRDLLDLLKKEEDRRDLPKLNGIELTKKFLLSYVKYDLNDGLGSYEVWKVGRIDDFGNNTYSLYPDKTIVANVDGVRTIDTYVEDVFIETESDIERFTVISKDEYDEEFEKAIDYYKSIKPN